MYSLIRTTPIIVVVVAVTTAIMAPMMDAFVVVTSSTMQQRHAFVGTRPHFPPERSTTSQIFMSDDFAQETPDDTRERIQALVENHPVLLFMKGSKLFPQCGFSNTATQILNSYSIDYHTVDVLSDERIRQGIKEYSSWPTIPQLYVAGEFLGGSDIMIEMYQSGELGELIEKAKADMIQ